MNKTEKKIIQLEKQIQENHVTNETELLITEMKKIGIEKLPYSYSALKQFIDSETMNFHYNKHYKGYVDKLNDALSKKKYGDLDLEKIIKSISRYDKTIRNNAGGAFNHALFWNMLSPKPMKLKGSLEEKIKKQFKSFNNFKKEFDTIAKERFGSGWVWLVLTSQNKLKIMSTPNQDNPLMNVIEGGGFPLLGLDLWEHAYYLKYRNKRDEYISNFWKVVNWDFVSKMYEMKTETRLAESIKFKAILSEGKSEKCGSEFVEAARVMFNVNPRIKYEYSDGINRILKEVFRENWAEKDNQGNLAGIYNFESPGRSVLNKLNTNYNVFCILMNDVNKVIKSIDPKKPLISFSDKTPAQQLSEITRFIKALDHFKFRIFDKDSSTFQNMMRTLIETDSAGDKREEITVAIINRFFGGKFAVKTGELGGEEDMLKGIDAKITKDGKTHTAQIKGYKERIDKNDNIILKGTGNVKHYNTDWLIFQKGKTVLIFNKKPNIIGGNFVFPKDGLLYDIK
jgi:superoxide dismutase, Fe-Mn family